MAIPDDALKRLPPRAYDEIEPDVRTGDLILCSGDGAFSRLIRWATGSPWSHIALVVRMESIGRVMVLESVERIGVRAVALRSFLTADSSGRKPYPGKLLLARHDQFADKVTDARMVEMADFAVDRLGSPFNPKEIAKIGLRILAGAMNLRVRGRLNPDDEFICSEYVGRCYERIGIRIPWDGRGFVAPSDFAQDPDLHAVAQIQRL